jgi:hypothetical protein
LAICWIYNAQCYPLDLLDGSSGTTRYKLTRRTLSAHATRESRRMDCRQWPVRPSTPVYFTSFNENSRTLQQYTSAVHLNSFNENSSTFQQYTSIVSMRTAVHFSSTLQQYTSIASMRHSVHISAVSNENVNLGRLVTEIQRVAIKPPAIIPFYKELYCLPTTPTMHPRLSKRMRPRVASTYPLLCRYYHCYGLAHQELEAWANTYNASQFSWGM